MPAVKLIRPYINHNEFDQKVQANFIYCEEILILNYKS